MLIGKPIQNQVISQKSAQKNVKNDFILKKFSITIIVIIRYIYIEDLSIEKIIKITDLYTKR